VKPPGNNRSGTMKNYILVVYQEKADSIKPLLVEIKRGRRDFNRYRKGVIGRHQIIDGGILLRTKDVEELIRSTLRDVDKLRNKHAKHGPKLKICGSVPVDYERNDEPGMGGNRHE